MSFLTGILEWLAKFAFGWFTGKRNAAQAQQQTDRAITAEAKTEQADAIIQTQEARHEVEQSVSKLPEAPAQRVGDAAAGTSAGILHDDWSRD